MLENRIQQITCTVSRKRLIYAKIKGKQLLRIKFCLFSSIKSQNILVREGKWYFYRIESSSVVGQIDLIVPPNMI